MPFKPTTSQKTSDKSIIYGTRPVLEALEAGKDIDKLFIQKGLTNDPLMLIRQIAAEREIPFSIAPIERLNRVTRKNHQGVVAYLSSVEYASLDHIVSECYQIGKTPLVMLLDRITDVRNFGAIARSADCLGADALVVPSKETALIGPDALKTSAGALNYLPVCREPSLEKAIQYLQDSGLRVVACTEKAQKPLWECELSGPIAIVMGSEENGISQPVLGMCDERAFIPMTGNIASLNVSVASGIMLSEVARQRREG